MIYSSCTKPDATDLGTDLIPAVDNVHTFETILEVETDNFLYPDTTRLNYNDIFPLGQIGDDPVFGNTTADLYVGFIPTSANPFINKDSVTIDSVVVSLAYQGLYADSTSVQNIDVTQISNAGSNFWEPSNYRISHAPFATTGGVIGTKSVDFRTLNDSVYYVNNGTDSIRTNNELRIRLDNNIGQQLLALDTATDYKTDSNFVRKFRGLVFKANNASPAKRSLAYFNLAADKSRLMVYCRVIKNGIKDTISPYFVAGATGYPAYRYAANYASLIRQTPAHDYKNYLLNGNVKDDKVFIQSTPGSYATVTIPGLDTFKTVNRVVHKAELILPRIDATDDNLYTPPSLMFIDMVNETRDSSFTVRNDFVYTGSAPNYYDVANQGGFYSTSNKNYVFNLTRYMQSLVTKNLRAFKTMRVYAPLETHPHISTPDGKSVANINFPSLTINTPISNGRVVLGGGNHATQKARIRIIYSKI
nr:DUF4270 family protein [Pseudoflavitalea sp. G-6-1-2]